MQADREDQPFTSLPFRIEAQQTLYQTLEFTLPCEFFEESQALLKQSQLALEYPSELFLYQAPLNGGSPRLIGYQSFDISTRPSRVYLDFLPEIYQESDFLGRFLSICEQALEPSFEMADQFWAYLNPLTAPKALVPFLAHWVAWPMNPRWTLSQQRRLIRHAVEIYQWRGSRYGLQLCLHLCTGLPLDDRHIQIEDAETVGFTLGDAVLSDEPCLGGGVAYHFAVTLRSDTTEQAHALHTAEAALRSLIEQEKPAFCTYDLRLLEAPAIPRPAQDR